MYFEPFTPYITYDLNSLNRKQFADKGARLVMTARYVTGNFEDIPGSTSKDVNKSSGIIVFSSR